MLLVGERGSASANYCQQSDAPANIASEIE
jgi:hypothetical protein